MSGAKRGMTSLSEDGFLAVFRSLSKHDQKRILKRIEDIPETPEQFWKSCKDLNPSFEATRRTFLESAGWDPTGWILQDWATLPNLMKRDFNKIWPSYKDDIRRESLKLARELAESKKR